MKILLVLLTATSLVFAQDAWKGDEYAKNSESQKASADDFMQGLSLKGVRSILDVGCGDGKITAAMARAIPEGRVVGVDISSSMIEFALKAFSNTPNLKFQVQDAAHLHFHEKFDLITSFTVMQWVLKQTEALNGFAQILNPGGKLCIQMPTGLPTAMEQALEKTITSEKWQSYFTGFAAPWKFYQAEEYRALLLQTHFVPIRLDVIAKHERFPSRAAFHGFLKQWFPYLRPLPTELKEVFLTELLDHYLSLLPADADGKVSFIVNRLEIEALKP